MSTNAQPEVTKTTATLDTRKHGWPTNLQVGDTIRLIDSGIVFKVTEVDKHGTATLERQ